MIQFFRLEYLGHVDYSRNIPWVIVIPGDRSDLASWATKSGVVFLSRPVRDDAHGRPFRRNEWPRAATI